MWAPGLFSVALHTLVLGLLAATSLQMVHEDQVPIPLVIRDPAPPPPPPGGGAAVGPPAALVSAPLEPPKAVEQPVPVVEPKPVEKPKPIEKPKIATKPKPPARPRPTRAAAEPPRPVAPEVPAAATAGGEIAGGAAGMIGGTWGGAAGGKIGRLGASGDEVFRADQVAAPPRVLESVRPQYPPVARARGQEGIVVVQAIVDRAGAVERDSLRILQSQNPFDDAAVAAFRRWRFRPGRDDAGQAVRVIVQQSIRFQLR
jgi:protein TonB